MSNDNTTAGEEKIMALAAEMPREVMPDRDLWPAIAASMDDGHGRQRAAGSTHWLARAAAVVLLVGASSGMTWLMLENNGSTAGPGQGTAELTFQPVSGSIGSQYTLGPDFQDARDSLVGKLDEELLRLPPDTRAEVEQNMQVIRAAIAEINKALAEEPDNALLQELLISTYSEELAIMRKVDVIANAAMHRTDI